MGIVGVLRLYSAPRGVIGLLLLVPWRVVALGLVLGLIVAKVGGVLGFCCCCLRRRRGVVARRVQVGLIGRIHCIF